MAVVNRCTVGIHPSQALLDWARPLELDVDVAGASEPCLNAMTGIATPAPGRRSAPTRCSASGSTCVTTP